MEGAAARARAALLGAFVADAATSPLHWIYNSTRLRDVLTKPEDRTAGPEFFEKPSCPFYQTTVGALSPYGQELLPLVRFLANTGDCEAQQWSKYLAAHYASEDPPLVYVSHSAKTMRDAVLSDNKPWPDCGDPMDHQACFVKAPAVVALYGGLPDDGRALRSAINVAVRAQQNNDTAVELAWAAARILERVMVTGESVEAALVWVLGPDGGLPEKSKAREAVQEVLAKKDVKPRSLMYADGPDVKFGPWGAGCGNPGCFKAALLISLQASDYTAGVRANLLLGGDNCSRAILVGALLAAKGGIGCIPTEWINQMPDYEELDNTVGRLVATRQAKYGLTAASVAAAGTFGTAVTMEKQNGHSTNPVITTDGSANGANGAVLAAGIETAEANGNHVAESATTAQEQATTVDSPRDAGVVDAQQITVGVGEEPATVATKEVNEAVSTAQDTVVQGTAPLTNGAVAVGNGKVHEVKEAAHSAEPRAREQPAQAQANAQQATTSEVAQVHDTANGAAAQATAASPQDAQARSTAATAASEAGSVAAGLSPNAAGSPASKHASEIAADVQDGGAASGAARSTVAKAQAATATSDEHKAVTGAGKKGKTKDGDKPVCCVVM